MPKSGGSEDKRLRSGKEKNSKEKSSEFTCIHCGKNNYKCPQEMIPYGENREANNDAAAVKVDKRKNGQVQPFVPEEIDPFTENIRNAELSKNIRMPDNIQFYDGSEYPVNHVATQCHMFKHTLRGAARVWFEHLPQESISSFHELRDAFLESFLSMKRHKDRDKKVRCTKKGRN
ncbi:retrotransposon gag domain-containing protein [Artemisia annua]|uniref:Retrotransposon gag domain-containing protein n=1 Tax=Artemisia annua TaxID=35608 RepID=A0A2U1Q9J7_ARTAN|nr:retrotransposon gag domain-containing protein [Artemisia annua]